MRRPKSRSSFSDSQFSIPSPIPTKEKSHSGFSDAWSPYPTQEQGDSRGEKVLEREEKPA